MFKLFIGTTLNPKQVIASGSDTIRSIYEDNNLPISGVVTLNGEPMNNDDLVTPINHLDITDGDVITVTKKYASA